MHTIYTCGPGQIESVNIGCFIPHISHYGQQQPSGNYLGPVPYIPAVKGANKISLFTGQKGQLTFGARPSQLYAAGLLSCASVIYTSIDAPALTCAHVHHANCGTLTDTDIYKAIQSLYPENCPIDIRKTLVIYAHPGSNPLYGKEIEKLQDCDIPLDNIIEIEELPSPNFGIDNNGYIGFI